MHTRSLKAWQHDHVFLGESHDANERRTWAVVALTGAMMVAEIVGGTLFGSMAVVADGWHMATHAGALAIAAVAYRVARKNAANPGFTFGTGKIGELAGFASAVVMAMVALLVAWESVERLIRPVEIAFGQAIGLAVVGLAVNLVSAWLLFDPHHHRHDHGFAGHAGAHDDHDHDHDHDHHDGDHDHGHAHHTDNNLRAAYFHVLADALTSVLAVVALLAARYLGWTVMDPLMGIVGAVLITQWSVGLLRAAGGVLVDRVPDARLVKTIRDKLEVGDDRVSDLHVWRVGPGHLAVIAAVVSDDPQPPAHYKARLAGLTVLSHVTIEVHGCDAHDHDVGETVRRLSAAA
ncbi:CDF family Co(II)/Ni(II) efflux transporter DmeF [Rhodoplanes azumiensis]|uniref:CDF family Co(II)/Ni(II) efflux transporter DmeF n=1 Tax=Rhodoplanes azumiensis TaxID=1897628 RepID=A0ABW5AQX2_9BRAD